MPHGDHEALRIHEPRVLVVGDLVALADARAGDLQPELLLDQVGHVILGDAGLGDGVHQLDHLIQLHDSRGVPGCGERLEGASSGAQALQGDLLVVPRGQELVEELVPPALPQPQADVLAELVPAVRQVPEVLELRRRGRGGRADALQAVQVRLADPREAAAVLQVAGQGLATGHPLVRQQHGVRVFLGGGDGGVGVDHRALVEHAGDECVGGDVHLEVVPDKCD
mmetsp:Transcript_1420/g.3110  ORF Transcript_1420/g.3110 Transcript_1420/m.3110 type:complete len:225 (-) Transcript_1420:35-709(-)